MAPKREDPIEKIGRMIDEKINAAFEGRQRKENEDKDPWARLEGIVDRAVDKHFQAFAQALEDEDAGDDKAAGKKGRREDEDRGPLSLFG